MRPSGWTTSVSLMGARFEVEKRGGVSPAEVLGGVVIGCQVPGFKLKVASYSNLCIINLPADEVQRSKAF